MIGLALKILLGDRAKFAMLVGGITFACLLITQQCGVFIGLLSWINGHLRNIRAPIWVVDPKVEQVNEIKSLRDTDVTRVRSVVGVDWAVPLYVGVLQAKLADGNFKPTLVIGLDSSTLIGRPAKIVAGRLQDLKLPNSVIIDELAARRLSAGRAKPIGVGDTFEINDREAKVVAICKSERHFYSYPYLYATYEHALQFAPQTRKMLSVVLAGPKPGVSAEQAVINIEKTTRLRAYTEQQFAAASIKWFFRNSGIPFSFAVTVALGVLVGVAVCGQTFYSFVLENMRHLGALKAMGTDNLTLARMLLAQALSVGFIGYGLGLGLAAMFGLAVLSKGEPPFSLPWQLPVATFFVIQFICIAAALAAIRKVWMIEPAIVFRS